MDQGLGFALSVERFPVLVSADPFFSLRGGCVDITLVVRASVGRAELSFSFLLPALPSLDLFSLVPSSFPLPQIYLPIGGNPSKREISKITLSRSFFFFRFFFFLYFSSAPFLMADRVIFLIFPCPPSSSNPKRTTKLTNQNLYGSDIIQMPLTPSLSPSPFPTPPLSLPPAQSATAENVRSNQPRTKPQV